MPKAQRSKVFEGSKVPSVSIMVLELVYTLTAGPIATWMRHFFQSLAAFSRMLLTIDMAYPPSGIRLTVYVL